MATYQTSKLERASYGSYFAGQNMILIIVLQFLMIFYTDVVGISAAAVGTLFLVARIWDAVNDPIMGILVDKISFKSGKFKPWISIAIFILPLATIFLFLDVSHTPEMKLVYAYTTYIVWGMLYTISDIPIFALATVMSDDIDERTRIISIGRLAAGIGAVFGVVIISPLANALGWSLAMTGVAGLTFLLMLPVKYKAMERVIYQRTRKQPFVKLIQSILGNKYLLVFYGVVILANLTNTSSATVVYFVKYNLGNENLIAVLSLAAASSAIILPFFLPKWIHAVGKRHVFMSSMFISIASSLAFYAIGYSNVVVVFVFVALKYIALNIPIVMMGLFTADCLEYDYYHSGSRNEGIVFSAQTFAIKMTLALQGIMGAFALSRAHYLPNVVQSPETLNEIWKMTTIYPVFGQILALIVFWRFYKLSEEEVGRMIKHGKQSIEE